MVTDLRHDVPETGQTGFYEAFYSPLYGSGGECIAARSGAMDERLR